METLASRLCVLNSHKLPLAESMCVPCHCRRLRAAFADVKQRAPTWRRQAKEFAATPAGKASLVVVAVLLISSGAVFQLLHLFWLVWWLSVPVTMFLASEACKNASAGGATSAWGPSPGSSSNVKSSRSRSSSNGRGWEKDGPVVDAQWTSLDADDQPKWR